jgi:glutathione S-transferase
MYQSFLRKFLLPTSVILFTLQPIKPLLALPLPQSDFTQLSESNQKPTKQTKLQLYGSPKTRTPMIQWYLEELGISYDYISLNIMADEHHKPEFLAINPMGKVPAMVDGDLKLWESGAILLYLAEKYQQMPNSLGERAKIEQWVIFANATLSPALFTADKREKEMPILLTALNKILQKQPFVLGEKLTAGDIAVASYLHYAKLLLSLDYSQYPSIVTYLDKIAARPAFKNTVGKP